MVRKARPTRMSGNGKKRTCGPPGPVIRIRAHSSRSRRSARMAVPDPGCVETRAFEDWAAVIRLALRI